MGVVAPGEKKIYIIRLASNEIFSPSNKIHREVGRAKDLSAPRVESKQSVPCVRGLDEVLPPRRSGFSPRIDFVRFITIVRCSVD